MERDIFGEIRAMQDEIDSLFEMRRNRAFPRMIESREIMPLPVKVNPAKAAAEYNNRVLRIEAQKAENNKKRIEIK